MKKFCYGTILWLSSLALVVLLAGCSGKVDSWADRENAAKDGFLYAVGSIAVENYNSKGEKEIQEFSQPPQRVVAVWQNSIETLLALGVGDRWKLPLVFRMKNTFPRRIGKLTGRSRIRASAIWIWKQSL